MQILILGAGQLARMMTLAGAPLGINVSAFDVVSNTVIHPLTKQALPYVDLADAIEQCDVITAEFEHIPTTILEQCDKSGKLKPNAQAILTGGDRRIEKALLDKADVANASYVVLKTYTELIQAVKKLGLPLVLKTALGGYDGKGQWRLKEERDINAVWQEISTVLAENSAQAIVAESFIPFTSEVSILGARNQAGDMSIYPLTQNIHLDGILRLSHTAVTLPAQDSTSSSANSLQHQAQSIFESIANELNYVGVLAVELFNVNGKLLVNEIAPRVHNSGHWTMQGADICQFENHLRAICAIPFSAEKQVSSQPSAMINILGIDKLPTELFLQPNSHVHWYGKEKRDGRKMGHINVIAQSNGALKLKLLEIAKRLDPHAFPELDTIISQI